MPIGVCSSFCPSTSSLCLSCEYADEWEKQQGREALALEKSISSRRKREKWLKSLILESVFICSRCKSRYIGKSKRQLNKIWISNREIKQYNLPMKSFICCKYEVSE